MSGGPEISRRDRAILEFVSLTGVASSRQVERYAFIDGASSPLSAARRCRRVLERLHRDGYLLRLDRRIGGARSGSAGWLYQLATRGKRALGRTGRGRTWEPGARFVDHALAVTELHLQLVEADRADRLSGLLVEHEPAVWRRFNTPFGLETLKPDLLVELTNPTGWELRWFVEVDRGSEHLPTVLGKCQLYERYWRSGHEATRHEVFPRICWTVPNDRRAAAIRTAIQRAGSLTDDLFRVTTSAQSVAVLVGVCPSDGGSS